MQAHFLWPLLKRKAFLLRLNKGSNFLQSAFWIWSKGFSLVRECNVFLQCCITLGPARQFSLQNKTAVKQTPRERETLPCMSWPLSVKHAAKITFAQYKCGTFQSIIYPADKNNSIGIHVSSILAWGKSRAGLPTPFIAKIPGNFCFSDRYFIENCRWMPVKLLSETTQNIYSSKV